MESGTNNPSSCAKTGTVLPGDESLTTSGQLMICFSLLEPESIYLTHRLPKDRSWFILTVHFTLEKYPDLSNKLYGYHT